MWPRLNNQPSKRLRDKKGSKKEEGRAVVKGHVERNPSVVTKAGPGVRRKMMKSSRSLNLHHLTKNIQLDTGEDRESKKSLSLLKLRSHPCQAPFLRAQMNRLITKLKPTSMKRLTF